jgi:lipopolysaccharide assembly protein A
LREGLGGRVVHAASAPPPNPLPQGEEEKYFDAVMRLLIALPLLLIMVLFALSNTAPVRLHLWPTDYALELPLSLAVLGGMAIAFLLGGVLVWLSELAQRRRARRAEHAVRLLEAQLVELKARLPQAPPP